MCVVNYDKILEKGRFKGFILFIYLFFSWYLPSEKFEGGLTGHSFYRGVKAEEKANLF